MQKYRSLIISLLIMITFFFVIRMLSQDVNRQTHEIYFSDFLDSVQKGAFTSVEINGNEITAQTREGNRVVAIGPPKANYIDILQDNNVMIKVNDSESRPFLLSFFINYGPIILLIGFWIFMLKRSSGGNGAKLFSINKSKAKRIGPEDNDVTFSDVAGIDESKDELYEIIDFLKDPDRFIELGGRVPRGVLMVGPPGNGKTLLAKAVAGEAKVNFFSTAGSDFVEMFVGIGAGRVRDLFEEARNSGPAIIFIDEIDAVGRHRGAGLGGGHDEREQTLNQMLVEMDGFDKSSNVIVIAATNRVDILDPALLRPGRFDRQVYVNFPDIKGRLAILKIYEKKVTVSKNVNLETIARGTPGFSGSELANLINEAALWAARNNCKQIEQSHLEWARDKIMMGGERRSMKMSDEEKKITSYHEAGHALVAAHLKKIDPLHKITIIPRGQALGVTAFLPEHDKLSMDKEELTEKITVSMGGRAAEEITFNEITTGAEGDFNYSTQLAYKMIGCWGMSEKLGVLTVNTEHDGQFLPMDYNKKKTSEKMLEAVDREVSHLLKSCYENALAILKKHHETLNKIAEELLKKETIDAEEFKVLLNAPKSV